MVTNSKFMTSYSFMRKVNWKVFKCNMKELGDSNKRFRFFRRSFQFCSVIIFCLYFCKFNYICRKIALFIDSIFLIILMIWLGTKRKEIVFGNKERHLLLVFRCALNHQKNLVHKNLSLEWIIYQVKRLTNSTAKVTFSLLKLESIHCVYWYSNQMQLFVISSTECYFEIISKYLISNFHLYIHSSCRKQIIL